MTEQLIRVLTHYYGKQHYASRHGRVTICSRRYEYHVSEIEGARDWPDCSQCVRIAAREELAVSP